MQARVERSQEPVVPPQWQAQSQPRYGTPQARRDEARKLEVRDRLEAEDRERLVVRLRERREVEAVRRAEEARIVADEEREARSRRIPDPGPAYLVSLSAPATEPLRARLPKEEQQSPLGRQIDMYA